MPREPNTSDARGMWDVTRPNQQRNAEYGERWPPTYVPYSSQQQYIRRQSGTWGGLTDGTTTNAYPVTNPAGTNLSGTSGWSFSGNNCDAISFYVESSYATTYQINKFAVGALNNVSSADTNNNYFYLAINETRYTGGTELYQKYYPQYNFVWWGNGSSFANSYGVQLITLPSTDSYSRSIPTLTVGTNQWYTAKMGYASGGEGSMNAYAGSSWDYNGSTGRHERTITTGGGTVTMVFDTPYFNGGGVWGSSNGTNNTAGQHLIFGIIV